MQRDILVLFEVKCILIETIFGQHLNFIILHQEFDHSSLSQRLDLDHID